MSNTLATITPHGWILALFIRDDGERLLLGDGYYEFKEEQRHFVANTYINDVVELQGTDGQLIAGQVRRSQAQPFDGYICDPTIDQATTEQKRRDFFLFFRKNHEYKVVYIFPNGDAIQRTGGYIVDAPEIREIIQRSPEYHVALAFEDVNYYTYAEAPDGSEKYTYEAELAPVFATDGGLLWDGKGMVSDSLSLILNGINGDTFQQKYSGKNLFDKENPNIYHYNPTTQGQALQPLAGANTVFVKIQPNTAVTVSSTDRSKLDSYASVIFISGEPEDATTWITRTAFGTRDTVSVTAPANAAYIGVYVIYSSTQATIDAALATLQIEYGSTATDYEPFVGGQASPNPDYPQAIQTVTGSQTITIAGTNYPLDLGTIELNGLGDDGNGNPLYKDRIFKDGSDWKIHKETGKFVFTAETTPADGRSKNGNIGFVINAPNNPLPNKHIPLVGACSHFGIEESSTTWTGIRRTGMNSVGALWFQTGNADYPDSRTITQFFDWLASSGVTYDYALATPTETTITDQTLVAQLEAIRTALAGGGRITITPTGSNLAVKLDTTSTGTGGLIWEASSSGTPITVNIQGVDKAYPILEITGPAVDPVLTNITTGEEFFWTGTVPSGQTLRVDMREMTATLNGANVFEFVSGSWVGFEPGPNTVRYTAASATYPAKIYYNEVVG